MKLLGLATIFIERVLKGNKSVVLQKEESCYRRVQLGSIEQIGHRGRHRGRPKLQFSKTGSIQLNRGVGSMGSVHID